MSPYTLKFKLLIANILEPKRLNLYIWWFEIGAAVELWGPPRVGGPIPPSKLQIQNTHKKCWLLKPKRLNLDVWWFEIGAPVELWDLPCVGRSNFTFKTSNSKHPQKKLASWTKMAKFIILVIWNWGPSGIMRSPTCWGANSTFEASNSKHPQKMLALWAKTAKLDVWWFEIGALVELWGPPCVGGPIPPSKPQIQNTYKKCWLLEPKWLNL
jgi:hypothetical protein